jgi:hypothetical protein
MKFWLVQPRVFVELERKWCQYCGGTGTLGIGDEQEVCSTCGGAGTIPVGYHAEGGEYYTDEHTECLHPNDPNCNCWNCT